MPLWSEQSAFALIQLNAALSEVGDRACVVELDGAVELVDTADHDCLPVRGLPACRRDRYDFHDCAIAILSAPVSLYRGRRSTFARAAESSSKMKTINKRSGVYAGLTGISVLALLAACSGTAGTPGTSGASAVTRTSKEAAGANCANGGSKVDFGQDKNADGKLDDAEVSGSVFICDGASGPVGGNGANGEAGVSAPAALVEGSSLPVGDANCPAGGLEVKTGIDANRNGVLDAGEFVATFSCNGAATRGDAGPTGATGAQGDAGATGATGASGLNSLIKLTTEPAGGNCGGGGVKIESGLDSNSNNVLDAGEVTSTAYVCNASLGYFALTGAPTHATVFNATAETYRFGNNLTNSIWNRQSNVIVTGEYSTQGYWAFAESTNNYTAGPNVGTNFHERMVQIPATNTVVFSNAATSAGTGVGAGTASLVMVATISTSTGLLTAGVSAVFSDAFAGSCTLHSSSGNRFLCYDGGSLIKRYGTTAGSPNLTWLGDVTLSGTALPAAAKCTAGSACFGSTFAWDGAYYYFANDEGSSTNLAYTVYDASGVFVATDTATGSGAIDGVYFDWSVGRYSTHDGFGGRTGGAVFAAVGGTSDTHNFGAVSTTHTLQ